MEWYELLLSWYKLNKRRFPWRETRDWYKCLVAEFLLVRTRSETVNKVYRDFLERFPTPQELCRASEEEILVFFKRLGLLNRAYRLKQTVCTIVYKGVFPCSYTELTKLPGIGDYVARVLLTRVCSDPQPFVDSNVLRVMSRFLGLDKVSKERVCEWIERSVPKDILEEVNLALLDLAATVCKPRNPRCFQCPLQTMCMSAKK